MDMRSGAGKKFVNGGGICKSKKYLVDESIQRIV